MKPENESMERSSGNGSGQLLRHGSESWVPSGKKHFGEDYSGTRCHDCWSAHNNTTAKAGHQPCHPDIQRELIVSGPIALTPSYLHLKKRVILFGQMDLIQIFEKLLLKAII